MDAFDLFKLMLDEYSSEILSLTQERSMNAIELSEALGIPMAACYRRIRALKAAGILREDGKAVSIGGKTVVRYRSSVDSAEVVLQDGRLKILVNVDGRTSSDEIMLTEEPTMLHWAAKKTER
jgi:DNA-binding Lrp family transcriptional regulator